MKGVHRRVFGMLAVLLLAGGVVAASAQPQLAGTWVLDRAQSQFPAHEGKGQRGPGGPDAQAQPADVRLVVEQQGNTIKATRTMARGNREQSMTETYVTDGTEQTQAGRRGGNRVTKATLSGDRFVVSEKHTMKGEQGERTMSRESVWTVSPDGRVLTIETTLQTPRGERNIKSVYNRG